MTDLQDLIELVRTKHLEMFEKLGITPGEYWRHRVNQAPTIPRVNKLVVEGSGPHPVMFVDAGSYALLVVAAQALLVELDGEPLDMEPEEYLESLGIKPPYSKRDLETARRAIIKGNESGRPA
jgi:hypothetical protein